MLPFCRTSIVVLHTLYAFIQHSVKFGYIIGKNEKYFLDGHTKEVVKATILQKESEKTR